MSGNKNIRVPDPLSFGIETLVQGKANAPNLGITTQPMELLLVFCLDGFSKRTEQMLQPGTMGDDSDLSFRTGCQPFHHFDSTAYNHVGRLPCLCPKLIVFAEKSLRREMYVS